MVDREATKEDTKYTEHLYPENTGVVTLEPGGRLELIVGIHERD